MVDNKTVYEYVKRYWKPERLNLLIAAVDASQNQIAEKTGIDINSLRNYCRGKTVPGMDAFFTFADYFNVPVDYLIGRGCDKDYEKLMSEYEHHFQSLRKAAYEDYLFKYNSAKALPSFENKYESEWPYNLYEAIFGRPPEVPITEEQERILGEVLASLPDREHEVLRLRFGADDSRKRTLDEVGKLFNLNRESIRSIEAHAINKLRQPSMTKWIFTEPVSVAEEYALQLKISKLKKRIQQLHGEIFTLEFRKEELERKYKSLSIHAEELGIYVDKEVKPLSADDFDEINEDYFRR